MTESTTGLSGSDLELLSRVIALSAQSRSAGHHPFAAIIAGTDGRILAQAMNASSRDRTAHAEMNALREASARCNPAELASATLYSSAEPCAMCAGGLYWAGVGRLVYAMSERTLLGLTGDDPENPTLSLPCREVFARGQRPVQVLGPFLEAEAAAVHAGFWRKRSA